MKLKRKKRQKKRRKIKMVNIGTQLNTTYTQNSEHHQTTQIIAVWNWNGKKAQ